MIENRQQSVTEPIEVVRMGIPHVPSTAVQIPSGTADLHDRHPGIRQTPRQQHALASQMIAVTLADFRIFLLEIVGVPD